MTYDESRAITPVEYTGLQEAYDHFTKALFDDKLPDVFLTYQRKANSAGYFAANRFSARVGSFEKHELALNPDAFIGHTDEQCCQTLVHEMAHVWQFHFGTPGSRGYHNREWAQKMKEIGLQPSSTGSVGGRETGQHMSDYIIPGGRFTRAFAELAGTGWRLNLESAPHPRGSAPHPGGSEHHPGTRETTPNSKTKFTCPNRCQNAWGKPDLAILCKHCGSDMLPAVG